MRILVLGATGMLGHMLMRKLGADHQVTGTVRAGVPPAVEEHRIIRGVQADNFGSIMEAFATSRPEAVINCIGLIKQLKPRRRDLVELNAAFPHRLHQLCEATGARLIHLSTDCVFSGLVGNYTERSQPDPVDDYGLSKLMGEIEHGALTLRTSIVGREIAGANGLFEWFYSQRGGSVRGFRKAIYSGLTTLEMSRVISRVLEYHPELEGVWHLSSEPISKFDLLERLNAAASLNIEIAPDDTFLCDRSLDSNRFREAVKYQPPTWDEMIEEFVRDGERYESAR